MLVYIENKAAKFENSLGECVKSYTFECEKLYFLP